VTTAGDVLVSLVAAEHAAVYAYGVLGPRLDDAARTLALAAYDGHRQTRDSLLARLKSRGLTAPGASPAYVVPATTRAAALAVAVRLEEQLAVLWRDLVASTDLAAADLELRRLALRNLSDCAVRATRWRLAAGTRPATVPLPGQP
jgi:hypothetical protein